VYPIHPIYHGFINASYCEELARVVWWSDLWLVQGRLHCRHEHHRTDVAFLLLLRWILEKPAQCLSLMKGMRPEMHDQIVLHTRKRHLLAKAETILQAPDFGQDSGA
jgi:hypothetical protein